MVQDEGKSISDIARIDPCVVARFGRGLQLIAFCALAEKSYEFRRVKVLVLWGATGVGKSRIAHQLAGRDGFVLRQSNGNLWYDGYYGQKTLILDDFYGDIKHSDILDIFDGHQYRLDIKGAHSWAAWTQIIVTSNVAPDFWYRRGLAPELARRLSLIVELREAVDFTIPIKDQIDLDSIDWFE